MGNGRDKAPAPGWPPPPGRLLLHVCCAPCAAGPLEALLAAGADVELYFHNPNIHPVAEHDRRLKEVERLASGLDVPLAVAPYAPEEWWDACGGMAAEPERGGRCARCFALRLRAAALHAARGRRGVLATTLSLSRWKDAAQVNAAGLAAAAGAARFWDADWRKGGMQERAAAAARRWGFYRQRHCGCVHSLRPPCVKAVPPLD